MGTVPLERWVTNLSTAKGIVRLECKHLPCGHLYKKRHAPDQWLSCARVGCRAYHAFLRFSTLWSRCAQCDTWHKGRLMPGVMAPGEGTRELTRRQRCTFGKATVASQTIAVVIQAKRKTDIIVIEQAIAPTK